MTKKNETPPGREGLALFPDGKHREINTKAIKKQVSDWWFASESDRRFFERFRERRHIVRPACVSECEKLRMEGIPRLPAGAMWFAVVKRTGPSCARAWIAADADMVRVEVGEEDARAIWDDFGGPNDEVRP